MIEITDDITLHEGEIQEQFIRTSAPGGQHVNKTSTGVQLRFNVNDTSSLPDYAKDQLKVLAGSRMTTDGELVITATRHRSQKGNREDALNRLIDLVRQSLQIDKPRRKTRPSKAVHARRLDKKQQRSEVKKTRQPIRKEDY